MQLDRIRNGDHGRRVAGLVHDFGLINIDTDLGGGVGARIDDVQGERTREMFSSRKRWGFWGSSL